MIEDFYSSRYKIKQKLGEGGFGAVCSAYDTTRSREVALKFEKSDDELKRLQIEAKIYQAFNGAPEIPQFYGYSTESNYHLLSMELMGSSLEDLMRQQKNAKLSLKTVLMLADQMISCIEYIHQKEFIHRDIKPDNFCMGLGESENKVFLLDFGIMKYYINQKTRKHIEWCDGLNLSGTARYASIDALRGVEQSRRDDMESLGYVFVYLLKGTLPWMGIKVENGDEKRKYNQILQMKVRTKPEDLCKGLPEEFAKYFKLVSKLEFEEKPDYAKYRTMFRSALIRNGFVYDHIYDWTDPKLYKKSKKDSKKDKKNKNKNKNKRSYENQFIKQDDGLPNGLNIPVPESPVKKEGLGTDIPMLMENPNNNNDGIMKVPKMKNTGFKPYVPGEVKAKKFAEEPIKKEEEEGKKLKAVAKNITDGFAPPPEPPYFGKKPPKKLDLNEKLGGLIF